ncbi:MAG: cobalamin-dependent protein [Alphaproteobacteria bacterium]|nr:cobalamin-dependent protein [Alphaproteobacteria bacterium]
MSLNIWLADLTYTQQQISAELIPAAIGGIATFAEMRLGLDKPIRLFKYPEKLATSLASEGIPDIIGFSNYVWNFELGLSFARRIKTVRPQTIVVFGGPNYPVDKGEQEAFLRRHPEIDYYIIKEGEVAFANLVDALRTSGMKPNGLKDSLLSVHYLDKEGSAWLPPPTPRLEDLTAIPSPYTAGKLDEFFDGKLLPIIQTNRGCPFTCTFCVEGTAYYGKVYRSIREKVDAEIDYIANKITSSGTAKGFRNDLFIADSNFGMYAEDIETCRKIAQSQERFGWPGYISAATGKNQKARVLEAARLVKGAMRLAGSVQSLDESVLREINRKNISADELMQLALDAADVDSHSYSEVILALPGDSKTAHLSTLKTVMDAGFTRVGTHLLMLLPGSELGSAASRSKYEMDIRYRVLPRCFGKYEILGESVVAAEIEEVCVANKTLSFEDYLECRRFNLLVTVFYNEGIFDGLLQLFKLVGAKPSRWLEIMQGIPPSARLNEFFCLFEKATREELWPQLDELLAFVRQPGTIERYLNNEIGFNVLFTFKALSMTTYLDEITSLAREGAHRLLAEVKAKSDFIDLIDDLVAFDAACTRDIFTAPERPVEVVFAHDIEAFLENDARAAADVSCRLHEPLSYHFILDANQQDTVRKFVSLYGSDDAGVARILSKVFVKKLLRSPRRIPA